MTKKKRSKFANKRTPADILADRNIIRAMVIQKWSERDMTEELNIILGRMKKPYRLSRSQVHLDIKAMGL